MTTKGSQNRFPSLTAVGQASDPATPSTGDFKLFVADDGTFYLMDDTGAKVDLTASSGFTNPMTTAEDIIYGGASGVPTRKAKGSNDTFLGVNAGALAYRAVTDALLSTSDITTNNASTSKHGFAPKYPNDATKYLDGTGAYSVPAGAGGGGGLVFLQRQVASASAQLDFTGFITTDYDAYLFIIKSLVMATNHVNLWMRMGTGGGPTIDTGSNYSLDPFVFRNGGSGGGGGGTGLTKITLDYPNSDSIENGTAALAGVQGQVTLYDPSNTSLYKQVDGHVDYLDAAGFRVRNLMRGGYESTTAVTAIRFMASSGNITSGAIDCYGYKNS
jgi:hypothetical protein